jgi:ABC-type Fe3+/spermidine/putrescine transport system ATPase subunit
MNGRSEQAPGPFRLQVCGVSMAFDRTPVLDRVDLDVAPGEIVCLQGPSGCGKSTLLQVIAGLLIPDAGTVIVGGRDVTGLAPHRRAVSMVFQRPGLFPHLDVAGNIGYGLRLRRVARVEREHRVAELLELVGLPGFQGRDPLTLSGGEAQRVALARALAPRPSVLLLDEPLSALDAELRERLATELLAVLKVASVTTVHVTHDLAEARRFGDRVVTLAHLSKH